MHPKPEKCNDPGISYHRFNFFLQILSFLINLKVHDVSVLATQEYLCHTNLAQKRETFSKAKNTILKIVNAMVVAEYFFFLFYPFCIFYKVVIFGKNIVIYWYSDFPFKQSYWSCDRYFRLVWKRFSEIS